MTDSTIEAEYTAAYESTKEGVWMRRFLIELGVFLIASSPLNIYCDQNGRLCIRSLGITKRTNMCYRSFTSFENLLGEVKSTCARYIQI